MYVVTMYRCLNQELMLNFESHSYTLGVFADKEKAIFYSDAEMLARGGKYKAWLEFHQVDGIDGLLERGWVHHISNRFFEDKQYAERVQEEVQRVYGQECFQ